MKVSVILKSALCLLVALSVSVSDGYAQKQKKEQATGRDPSRTENTLRVLYWNIQDGMLADQENHYDKFVEWVKKYDPDVCIWAEASTVYGSVNDSERLERGTGYLPEGWWELAPRYGHEYVSIGSWMAFPQIITSKYPIETILKLWNTPDMGMTLSHGVGVHSIQVSDDLNVYFVTVHLHPYSYAEGVAKSERSQNAKEYGGEYMRVDQISYICDHTVNDPKFAEQENWVMAGDFNSINLTDNWYYDKSVKDKCYMTHEYIRKNTNLVDVIGKRYPNQFAATHRQKKRIDYVYASPAMYDRVVKAMVIHDEWTYDAYEENVGPAVKYEYPSDHHPILVDFKLD